MCADRQPILSGWHTCHWNLNLLEIAHSGRPDVPSAGLSADLSNGPIGAWAAGLFPVLALAESAGLRELADEHLSVSTRAPSATSVNSTRSLPCS